MVSNTTQYSLEVEELLVDLDLTSVDWQERVVFASLYCLLTTLIAAGNGLVLVVLCLAGSHKQTSSAGLVMNLAAADTLFSGTLLVHAVLLLDVRLSLNHALCLVHVLLLSFTSLGMQLSLLLVVAERYVAVRHPFRYSRIVKPATVLGAVLGVWVYSLLVTLLALHPTFKTPALELLCVAGDILAAKYALLMIVHYLVITVLSLLAGLSVTAIACRQHHKVKAAMLGVVQPQTTTIHETPPGGTERSVKESDQGERVVPQGVHESRFPKIAVPDEAWRESRMNAARVTAQSVKEAHHDRPTTEIQGQAVRESQSQTSGAVLLVKEAWLREKKVSEQAVLESHPLGVGVSWSDHAAQGPCSGEASKSNGATRECHSLIARDILQQTVRQTAECALNLVAMSTNGDLQQIKKARVQRKDHQLLTMNSSPQFIRKTTQEGGAPRDESTSQKTQYELFYEKLHALRSKLRHTLRFLRRSGLVSLLFALTWLPYTLAELMELTGWPISPTVRRVAIIIVFFMPLTNPIIYVWGNTKFRLTFLKSWRRLRTCSSLCSVPRVHPMQDGGSATATGPDSYL